MSEQAGAVTDGLSIDYPFEGEVVVSPGYSVRVRAPKAHAVEVSFDGGPWLACRSSDDFWWHDWTAYAGGEHVVCARAHEPGGGVSTLRPRAFRVELPVNGRKRLRLEGGSAPSGNGQALWLLRKQGVQFVQLWFSDVAGKPWRISLPVEQADETAFTSGVTLDGPSTCRSFSSYITLLPDPNAVFRDPLASVPTAAVVCDLIEPPDVGAAVLGVRQVLRESADALAGVLPGLTATVGAEPEFLLLDPAGAAAPEEEVWDFLYDLARTLGEAGIQVEGFRFGPAPGQGRVQMRWADPVRTADHVVLYRWWARVLARRRGRAVSFEPRLDASAAVSMPVHTSLWLGVENAFHDPKGWEYTSDRCRFYAGGLLRHAGALCALVAPTEASYPISAGSLATPLRAFLSREAGAALCRVPARLLSPSARRLKFRAGNASGNPYLAFAAMLLAGLDGMARRIDPPFEEDTEPLPGSLSEAVERLRADRAFLTGGPFGERLLDAWLAAVRGGARGASVQGAPEEAIAPRADAPREVAPSEATAPGSRDGSPSAVSPEVEGT